MKFSVIMPSFLGQYAGGATNREQKLIRAVESVRSQTHKDWELMICADGCQRTFDLICERYAQDENIDCALIHKQPKFGPAIRNVPLSRATGDYVIYLDSDDYYGPAHLSTIAGSIGEADWVYYHDLVPSGGQWVKRSAVLHHQKCGTSNITHKRGLDVQWSHSRYAYDDWTFIRDLKTKYPNYKEIPEAYYYVCHLPNKFDV